MLSRRAILRTVIAAPLGSVAFSLSSGRLAAQAPPAPTGPFTLPPLPYPADALEPHIDAQTMTIHHDRHHQAYVNNLNTAVAKFPDLQKMTVEQLIAGLDAVPAEIRTAVRNNGGGHANHSLFWTSLKKGGSKPGGEFAKAIDQAFGDFTKLQEALTRTATGVFGSGWSWLALDATGKLTVEPAPNQDSPGMQSRTPLLGIDVWEHAYYLKYQNRRPEYVAAIFNVIDWEAVGTRWMAAKK